MTWAGYSVLLPAAASPALSGLAVTLDDMTLVSTGTLDVIGTLAVTLDGSVLASSVQAGAGVIVEAGTASLAITLEDAVLVSEVTVDLVGTLSVTLDGAVLASTAIAGSLGPFTRRPIIVVN